MVVIGDKETAENSVNVRRRGQKEQESMPLADFITHAKMLIDSRSLAL
jgi:threonyl-tRNA synthetase